MGFKEELQKLSVQVNERMVHISNEETTKQSLIIPFIQVLGYDVFDPLEIKPEYVADFGKKRGEKVDYAIFKDGSPIIFVEAKSVNEKLSNHDAQLCRYFNAVTEVRIAIITNGTEYKFFTDLTADNVMDETPFLIVDLLNLRESDFETLLRFKKESFDKEFLVRYAEELVYTSTLDNSLKELFKNPDDEFIRYLIRDVSSSRITSSVIERFRPIVKKAISNAVIDIVSKGLYQQETESNTIVGKEDELEAIKAAGEPTANINSTKRAVVTSEDELNSFEYIKNVLSKADKDITNLNYKDTTAYFSIYVFNTTKWFLRLNIDGSIKNVITKLPLTEIETIVSEFKTELAPKSFGESRVIINSADDIKKLDQLIISCYEKLMN